MHPIVMCPLDGGAQSVRALPSAYDAAQLFDASIRLFSAVEDPHLEADRRSYLRELLAWYPPLPHGSEPEGPEAIVVVTDPHAPRAIAERAAQSDVLAVMATSSQPLMHNGYLGSAAERVVREASSPVLLIGPHANVRLRDVDKVALAVDGSALAEEMLTEAASWAARLNVQLWVVTVVSPGAVGSGVDGEAESNYVRSLARRVDAQWEVLHGDHAAESITAWGADALIALTTHGRSGLSRLTIGSVATGVTRWARGPVLVARHRRAGTDTAASLP